MGASFSNLTNLTKTQQIGIGIGCFLLMLVIILAVLGGLGVFGVFNSPITTSPTTYPTTSPTTYPTTYPTTPPAPLGSLAFFSPTNDSQIWKKVFDSLNKCFINFNSVPQIAQANLNKIRKYQINNGMLPIDNPFKNVVDVPVSGCSDDGTRLVLDLDLSAYGGVNPFKQGDIVYIFGIKGEMNANSEPNKMRYVYATNKEYPKFIPLQSQIMLSDTNPCNYMKDCNLDNSSPLFSNGTYTGGGTVRSVGNEYSGNGFISQRPMLMFYLYMAYKNYSFTWPYAPITATQAYSLYSSYYNEFMQWYANLPQTCTQASYVFNVADFVSGPVTVSGGSGAGMKMYIIKLDIMGNSIGVLMVTDDGFGYQSNESVTITQGSNSVDVTIQTDANCYQRDNKDSITGPLFLSYSTTQQQLKNLLNYAISIDSSINTIVMYSNNSTVVPDNYNNPNISLLLLNTTPDTINMSGIDYTGNLINMSKICICNGQQDQGSLQNFFPGKVNTCANQIIYTSDTNSTPFDFIGNAESTIGTCNVTCG